MRAGEFEETIANILAAALRDYGIRDEHREAAQAMIQQSRKRALGYRLKAVDDPLGMLEDIIVALYGDDLDPEAFIGSDQISEVVRILNEQQLAPVESELPQAAAPPAVPDDTAGTSLDIAPDLPAQPEEEIVREIPPLRCAAVGLHGSRCHKPMGHEGSHSCACTGITKKGKACELSLGHAGECVDDLPF